MGQTSPETWSSLAGNFAVVALVISIWAHAQSLLDPSLQRHVRSVLIGLACGLGAALSIMMSVPLATGVFIDLRSGLVAGATLAGGPVAGATAFTITFLIRLWISGAGAPDALLALSIVFGLSLSVSLLTTRRALAVRIAAAMIAQASLTTGLFQTLPSLVENEALARVGVPYVLLNTLVIALLGVVIETVNSRGLENRVLRAALNQAPDYLYVKDLHSKFVAVNRNTAEHHGYKSPKEMVGLDDFALVAEPRAHALYVQEQELMNSKTMMLDHPEHLNDRVYLTSKVPLLDSDGTIIGLAGVTKDITDRVKLEAEVTEKSRQLSHALTSMSDGFAVFDRKGTLLLCNEQYRAAFPKTGHLRVPGASIASILETSFLEGEVLNAGPPVGNVLPEIMMPMLEDGVQEIHICDDRWWNIKLKWNNDNAVVVLSEITASKQAEAALRETARTMRQFAETDGLTGLLNRRMFDEALARDVCSEFSTNRPVSLLLIDVDLFKAFNDHYGHQAGDECLRKIARCLQEVIKRGGDTLARYGGEEFVAVLPNTDGQAAIALAEEIRQQLHQLALPHERSPQGVVTVSIGVSTTKAGFVSGSEDTNLVREADIALYRAKNMGRDQSQAS